MSFVLLRCSDEEDRKRAIRSSLATQDASEFAYIVYAFVCNGSEDQIARFLSLLQNCSLFNLQNVNDMKESRKIFIKHKKLYFLMKLRTVPTIVIVHTFCASRDTRISYR